MSRTVKIQTLVVMHMLLMHKALHAQGTEQALQGAAMIVMVLFVLALINIILFASFLYSRKKWQRICVLLSGLIILCLCYPPGMASFSDDRGLDEIAITLIATIYGLAQIITAILVKKKSAQGI